MSQAIRATIKKLNQEDEHDSDYYPTSSSEASIDEDLNITLLEQIKKVEEIVNEFQSEFQELKTLVQLATPEDTFLLHRDDDDE